MLKSLLFFLHILHCSMVRLGDPINSMTNPTNDLFTAKNPERQHMQFSHQYNQNPSKRLFVYWAKVYWKKATFISFFTEKQLPYNWPATDVTVVMERLPSFTSINVQVQLYILKAIKIVPYMIFNRIIPPECKELHVVNLLHMTTYKGYRAYRGFTPFQIKVKKSFYFNHFFTGGEYVLRCCLKSDLFSSINQLPLSDFIVHPLTLWNSHRKGGKKYFCAQ